VLDTPQKRAVYQESDGRQIREVATAAHVGFGTVQKYWQDWSGKGLMEATDTAGRYRRVVSLDEIGLEVGD
jgi:transposase